MIRIDRASSRYHADYGWLKTYHSFSFGEYYRKSRLKAHGFHRGMKDGVAR
ncbi:Pirin, N-terminal [Geobacillus proteiniphilus]|uniref:Pirin, N-terminal n=1 Tax=Geobacillus proteiniphilus TaxID=860353 RepID=A0A1Q5T6Z9_9BACL|nr:Pirin, N-terminal [Geobacillus proteiniphilus]